MGNKLNPFEEQLKKAANNFEAPYDASAWSQLESKLDGMGGVDPSVTTKWFVAAMVIVTLGTGMYFYSQSSSTENTPPVITEKVTTEKDPETTPINMEEIRTIQKTNETNTVASKTVESNSEVSIVESESSEEIETNTTPVEITEQNEVAENPVQEKPQENISPKQTENNSSTQVAQTLQIETAKTTVCAGTEVQFELSKPTKNTIVWQIDNGSSIPDNELIHTFFEEGKHTVKAWDVDAGTESNELELMVNPKPDASFIISESMEEGAIPVVHFTANVTGEKYYKWMLGDGFSNNGEAITHTYKKAKDYEVSLQVMNKYGCNWTRYERYTNEKEFNLLAPNSFSPNGDGTNDVWFPKALASGYYNFELNIYDRNNRLVYTTNDPNGNWNGRVNGTNAIAGDFYIWNAVVTDPNGIHQQYNGIILVVN